MSNTLSCGIFGYMGKDPKKFSKDKLNILGIANQSRGIHSCGIAVDGEIQVGVGDVKLFTDFAIENRYDSPVKFPVVIGHTRQATFGKHTVENAHPFGFGDNKGNFRMYAVHNGTLVNHEDLAKKYKVDLTDTFKDDKGISTTRTKIDSELLLEIIYKTKSFKVLNEYIGAAALVWTDTTRPNVVYCYHGKSKLTEHDKDTIGERPLFYYQENKNSGYFSSLKAPLLMISQGAKEIYEFEYNKVYEITNGNVATAKKYVIKRENKWQKDYYYGCNFSNYTNHTSTYASTSKEKRKLRREANKKRKNKGKVINISDFNIHYESPRFSTEDIGGRPYFNKLSWLRNGHEITGVFTKIENYGLYDLKIEKDKKENLLSKLGKAKNAMLNSNFNREDAVFGGAITDSFIPFTDITKIPILFIYNGIMLKTRKDYEMALQFRGTKHEWTNEQLSHCSIHPVLSRPGITSKHAQGIMKDGLLYDGFYAEADLYRVYTIKLGNLTNITDFNISKNFYLKTKNNIQLALPLKTKDEENNNISPTNSSVGKTIVVKQVDSFLVLDTIDQIFENPIMDLMRGKQQLEKYLPDPKALEAIETIDVMVEYIKDLT